MGLTCTDEELDRIFDRVVKIVGERRAATEAEVEAIIREEIRAAARDRSAFGGVPMHLSVSEARSPSMGVLNRHGYGQGDAELIADVLVEAHLWGRPNSGLNHLPHVVESGERRSVSIIRENRRSVLFDGGTNPGFWCRRGRC